MYYSNSGWHVSSEFCSDVGFSLYIYIYYILHTFYVVVIHIATTLSSTSSTAVQCLLLLSSGFHCSVDSVWVLLPNADHGGQAAGKHDAARARLRHVRLRPCCCLRSSCMHACDDTEQRRVRLLLSASSLRSFQLCLLRAAAVAFVFFSFGLPDTLAPPLLILLVITFFGSAH